jgi:hypothetical protein
LRKVKEEMVRVGVKVGGGGLGLGNGLPAAGVAVKTAYLVVIAIM